MITMNLESILAFLNKNQYQADIQADTQQAYTVFKIEQKEFPLFVRIFDEGHLLQLLVFIPSLLEPNKNFSIEEVNAHAAAEPSKQNTLGDMARLLHLLNKELDVPGFGMDEMAGVVFYRLMLPTPKKKIEEDLLLAYVKTAEHVCKMFSTPIEAVSSGKMTLDEILEKAQKLENQE